MTQEEAKKQANELKKRLKSATGEEIVAIVGEVTSEMQLSQFRKPVVKYKAEAVLHNKKPQVNATTRATYVAFVTVAKSCATGNSHMLAKISAFEKAYLSNAKN